MTAIRRKTRFGENLRRPGFWLILSLLVLIGLPHFEEALFYATYFSGIFDSIGLSRHAFERVLFLAPITWAGFLFGWRGAFLVSLVALALMLTRVFTLSLYPVDALWETATVFIIGNAVSYGFTALRKEKEYHLRLEVAHEEQRAHIKLIEESETRYRELFDNIQDTIWLHDTEGDIITVNQAGSDLTGYSLEELYYANIDLIFSPASLQIVDGIEQTVRKDNASSALYDMTLKRKDGRLVPVKLLVSPVFSAGDFSGYQHIIRDVTDEKRLRENQRYYVGQVTLAQEEERKRISRELHDGTVQSLVALARQMDSLIATGKDLSEETVTTLERMWRQVDGVVKEVRRLSQDLRPAALDRLGLLPALEWLVSNGSEFYGIRMNITVEGDERRLDENLELVLFRVAQEALRNIWKHARAAEADIKVIFAGKRVEIIIADNGIGFVPPGEMGDLPRDGKLGLAGMHERIQLVGGTLKVESAPGCGATLTFWIET
jgi:two-component system, NarL family, sensor histidine kinase DegS